MAKNILVTGCNGQLGNEINVISNLYSDFFFMFHDVETLDITSMSTIENFFSENKVDLIINCAAYTAVDKAESEPEIANLVNVTAVGNLAEVAKKHKVKIIHISTDYVFDGQHNLPYNEEHPTNPTGVYAKSKLDGEIALQQSGADYIIIRTAWLYSTFGNNFVKTMLRLGKERPELKVVFDQIGNPTYAADLAFAILEIVKITFQHPENFKSDIYHFANEGVCSWYDVAYETIKLANFSCRILPIETKEYPTPTKRPAYSVLNKLKIKSTFNLSIPHWRDGLERCIKLLV